ncbi:MAG TPA: SDR family NAD(P)-dependent oxidoreductase [Rhizobacter sp.]|nr:SDR family NAD(P)-dependent oxidoreductase [Rhizobacter sp.]
MKTVLITGASAGFGLAIAERFLSEGQRVIACARRLDKLQALADRFPGRVLPLPLDVTDKEAVRRNLSDLPAPFADVDVLVNNAGLALGLSAAPVADVDEWDRMIETNCSGLVHVTRAVLPQMLARGSGTVINLGSIAGEFPYPGGNVYGATKAFVHQFTQNLNADLIGTGVRASCIEPGLCGGTEFSTVRFAGDEKRAASVYDGVTPLSPEDIAGVVAWIAHQPPHVTINVVSLMPNGQSFGGMTIKRKN